MAKKDLVFSKHATEQMILRMISPHEVEQIVDHPDGSFAQSRDKYVAYKRFLKRRDNLIAAVVLKNHLEMIEVLTVMHHFEVRK